MRSHFRVIHKQPETTQTAGKASRRQAELYHAAPALQLRRLSLAKGSAWSLALPMPERDAWATACVRQPSRRKHI